MKVTFGVNNYNRLFYLKSCAESLMQSVEDYDGEIEFICIDDNSQEPGTKEYLKTLSDRGWKVINQEDRRVKPKKDIGIIKDVIDEFSSALNIFYKEATGDIIAPLQGDAQFIRKNWLQDYVALFSERNDVFCIGFDAQRRVRLEQGNFIGHCRHGNSIFAIKDHRMISGAGECFYRREFVEAMGGWRVGENTNAEDLFTWQAHRMFPDQKTYVPWIPVSIAIYTDPRGTMGRVRGNMRFGLYWEALSDNMYYKWVDLKNIKISRSRPVSIEELAIANGDWELPLYPDGS